MIQKIFIKSALALTLAGCTLFSASAFAGECPAGKSGIDLIKSGATAPSNVTDTVISSIDLGAGYNIPGRSFRMRRLVIQPGGIVPWHSHSERPAHIYVISGEVSEMRSTCSVPVKHVSGDVVAEQGSTSHWWRNDSKKEVVLISADILPQQAASE
jgi:quercetin dioxygenase-like cupin family protein